MSLVIQENVNLSSMNTFGVEAQARYFIRFSSKEELIEVFQKSVFDVPVKKENKVTRNASTKLPFLCLGEGSNILFVQPFSGVVLKNEIRGLEILKQTAESVSLKVGAGENWHKFVLHCVQQNWGGVENLSLIPGTVGAAPIQNIGAYGVEVQDVIEAVEIYDIEQKKFLILSKEECQFSYRDSIFKREGRGRWIITSVNFTLSKKPILRTHYGAIEIELKNQGISHPTIKDISDTVIKIRRSKLPDPKELGNAGSFFKNPVVTADFYSSLKQAHPQIIAYPEASGQYKIAAAWCIEQCGFKGWRQGACGVHSQQALVLVNYGTATGNEILALSERIRTKVFETFQIQLETEVQVIS